MAQLNDLVVNGSSRVVGTQYATTTQTLTIKVPATSGGTDYSVGTDGKVLKSNGTSTYWGDDNDTTYESKEAVSEGTDVSLVTTGEKYIWTNKQDEITSDNKLSYSLISDTPTKLSDFTDDVVSGNYLPLSGGTMTGTIAWGDSTALPQFESSPTYLLGIESFTDGGEMKWQNVSNINVGSADKVNIARDWTTSTHWFQFPLALSSGTQTLTEPTSMTLGTNYGTTDLMGNAILRLGTEAKTGSAANAKGELDIFSSQNGMGMITQPDITSNIRHYLPSVEGTLINSATVPDYVKSSLTTGDAWTTEEETTAQQKLGITDSKEWVLITTFTTDDISKEIDLTGYHQLGIKVIGAKSTANDTMSATFTEGGTCGLVTNLLTSSTKYGFAIFKDDEIFGVTTVASRTSTASRYGTNEYTTYNYYNRQLSEIVELHLATAVSAGTINVYAR